MPRPAMITRPHGTPESANSHGVDSADQTAVTDSGQVSSAIR